MSDFKIEKDWVTNVGLRAVVIIHPAGHRCGYVGVPAMGRTQTWLREP